MHLHDQIPGRWSGAIWHLLVPVLALLGFFLLGPQPYVWSLGSRLLDMPAGIGGLWTLSWLEHAITQPGLSLWSPPVLHPLENALALGQPQLGCLLIYLPASAITGNPTLALNLTILLGTVLCAYLTFLLVRRLSSNPWAGLAAGLLFAFNPLHWSPAPQGAIPGSFFWAPLALLALERVRPGRWWWLWGAALPVWVLTYTVPVQGLGMALLAVALLGGCLLLDQRTWLRDRWLWGHLAGMVAASGVVLFPLISRMGAQGGAALLGRATWPGTMALLTPPGEPLARTHGWLHALVGGGEGGIFPGLVLLLLLLLAAASLGAGQGRLRLVIKRCLQGVLFCGVAGVYAPGALGLVLLLMLCICAGLALAWVAPRVSGRPLPGRLALAAALLAAVNLDYWLVESPGLSHGPGTLPPEVYSYLERSPRKGPVLELPVSTSRLAFQPLHWRPDLAGPAWWRVDAMDELLSRTRSCPEEACRRFLRESTATIIVHGYKMAAGGKHSWMEADLSATGHALMGQVGDAFVWERSRRTFTPSAAAPADMPPPLPDDALEPGFEKSELKAMDAPP